MKKEAIKALSSIQSKLKAPKSQWNKFGKYNYRNLEDIMEAVKPLLAEHEAALVITDSIVNIGARFYVCATAVLYVGPDQISSIGMAREEESKKGFDSAQLTGSTSSYARKYACNGLFAIDDTRDEDLQNNTKEEKQPLITDAQVLEIEAKISDNDIDLPRVKAWMSKSIKVSEFRDLNAGGYTRLLSALNKRIKAKNDNT